MSWQFALTLLTALTLAAWFYWFSILALILIVRVPPRDNPTPPPTGTNDPPRTITAGQYDLLPRREIFQPNSSAAACITLHVKRVTIAIS